MRVKELYKGVIFGALYSLALLYPDFEDINAYAMETAYRFRATRLPITRVFITDMVTVALSRITCREGHLHFPRARYGLQQKVGSFKTSEQVEKESKN